MAKQARQLFAPVDEVIVARWENTVCGLPALPNGYFAHTITDPPYSEYVHAKKWTGGNKKSGPKESKVTFEPLTIEQLNAAATEIVRTTRGWVLVFCADDDMRAWRDALCGAGALRWPTCIWTKPNGAPQFRGEGPSQPCEHIVTAWCGESRPVWNGGGKMGHYNISTEPKKVRRHETQKPLRLMQHLVLDFTMPGDLIADIYAGAGTTGMAARLTGRRSVLWEENLKHATAAGKWIAPAVEQLRLEQMFAARPSAFGNELSATDSEQVQLDGVA